MNANWNCRIRRVRLKKGGADLILLPSHLERASREAYGVARHLAAYMMDPQNTLAGRYVGFAGIAWTNEGDFTTAIFTDRTWDSVLLPRFIEEAIRYRMSSIV